MKTKKRSVLSSIINKLLIFAFVLTSAMILPTAGKASAATASNYSFRYSSSYGWWKSSSYDAKKIDNTVVSGDFNGDGKTEVAAFYDYGKGVVRIHIWNSTGYSLSYESNNGWWTSKSYNINCIKGRVVAGDFNGDGLCDIAALYDYGNKTTKIHVWESTGTSFKFTSNDGWWSSSKGGYNPAMVTDRIVSGDFNGDGFCDIAAFYEYGAISTRIHVFESTGTAFTYKSNNGWWNSASYAPSKITNNIVSADFDGDGKCDIAAFYDYGNNTTRLHVWKSSNTYFTFQGKYGWWGSTTFSASQISGKIAAGDFNADGKPDISMFYDYGHNTTGNFVLKSTGTSFDLCGKTTWWISSLYNAKQINNKVIAGDFNGDGACDIGAFNDYGNSVTSFHVWTSNFLAKTGVTYTHYNYTLETMVNTQIALINNPKPCPPQAWSNQAGTWINATPAQVLKYVNPNNYNTDQYMYQFLDLSAPTGMSVNDIEAFLSNKGVLAGKSSSYLKAASGNNISEAYLLAHSCLETGNGTSDLAMGITVTEVDGKAVTPKKVYNMYGIGATDANPDKFGSETAYEMGWDTPEKAIEGGAKWIADRYINNATYKQNTLYKMRWNPDDPGHHQYATDVSWAVSQTGKIKQFYDSFDNILLHFDIPEYD